MQIDPRRLAVLRAVADAGGVLAAASVLHLTPSAVSQHIARLEAAGKFPKRIRLGVNRVGWLEQEVLAWLEERIAQRDIPGESSS